MSQIGEIIERIPEDSTDEALFAIETVVLYPASNSASLRVYPANEFRLTISVENNIVRIQAEGRPTVSCGPDTLVSHLKREIYAIDEAISVGAYSQTPPKEQIILEPPAPPADMDIPIWDEQTREWRDAEY